MIHMRLPIGVAAELRRVLGLDFRGLLETETHNDTDVCCGACQQSCVWVMDSRRAFESRLKHRVELGESGSNGT